MTLHAIESEVHQQSNKEQWSQFNYGRTLFQPIAKDYDNYMAILLTEIVKNKKVIAEYGCGDGIWLEYLAKKFPGKQFIGLEWNNHLVKYAKEKRVKNLKNVTIHQKDITKYSVDCDFLFAFGVMEHFDNATNVLRNWVDHLTSNGFALITVPNLLYTTYVHFRHKIPLEKLQGKDEMLVEAYGFEWLWSHNTFLKKIMDAGLEVLLYRIVEEMKERGQLVVAFKRGDKKQI